MLQHTHTHAHTHIQTHTHMHVTDNTDKCNWPHMARNTHIHTWESRKHTDRHTDTQLPTQIHTHKHTHTHTHTQTNRTGSSGLNPIYYIHSHIYSLDFATNTHSFDYKPHTQNCHMHTFSTHTKTHMKGLNGRMFCLGTFNRTHVKQSFSSPSQRQQHTPARATLCFAN